MTSITIPMTFHQAIVSLKDRSRGCHVITDEIVRSLPQLKTIRVGLLNILLKHTSASLALNECWDADVRVDTENFLNSLVPESFPFKHTIEGPDDMPAHLKCCFLGASLTIPVTNGCLNLGQWQGIWLCEHRNNKRKQVLHFTPTTSHMLWLIIEILQSDKEIRGRLCSHFKAPRNDSDHNYYSEDLRLNQIAKVATWPG